MTKFQTEEEFIGDKDESPQKMVVFGVEVSVSSDAKLFTGGE